MKVHRKGTDDTIKLRLALSQKSTDELTSIVRRQRPADAKTRKAAATVLRVRSMLARSTAAAATAAEVG